MDMFIPPTPVSGNFGVNGGYRSDTAKSQDASSQFASVFLQNMLKEIFKKQWKSGLADDGSAANGLYAEMLTDQLIGQLAESDAFGLNEIIASGIDKKNGGIVPKE